MHLRSSIPLYEATFSCGLCFPIHPFIMQLLSIINVAPSQLVPNAWRTIIGCMLIWASIHDRDMITLNEFLYSYHLKPSIHYEYFELLIGSHDNSPFLDLDGKPCLTTYKVRSRGCYENGKSLLLVRVSFLFIKLAVLGLLFFDLLFPFFFGSFLSSVVGGMLPRTN